MVLFLAIPPSGPPSALEMLPIHWSPLLCTRRAISSYPQSTRIHDMQCCGMQGVGGLPHGC